MAFQYRRVVTGHDSHGRAIVKEDELISSVERGADYDASTVWCTSALPVNNDESVYDRGVPGPKGSRVLMRIGEMRPGQAVTRPMHRTETLDYAVLLSGSCDMSLDSGEVIRNLKQGDVIIQRGTNHAWVLKSAVPVKFLFVLIDAHPVRCGDQVLGDFLDNLVGRAPPMSAG